MDELPSIESVARKVETYCSKKKADRNNFILLYAFNATGKTRLSKELAHSRYDANESMTSLFYNSFTEDIFSWDNEEIVLNIDSNSWVLKTIEDEGLERDIENNFNNLTNTKIDTEINYIEGYVEFKRNNERIKVSRGEESLFIWSVFFSILELALETLSLEEDNRSTKDFNFLSRIIIDDPVSSIDDKNIISLAVKLYELIKRYPKKQDNNQITFFILTHHPLFYNVLNNMLENKIFNNERVVLSKTIDGYKLEEMENKFFSYHLLAINEINNAINENNVGRIHFNLFRSVLEKTQAFFGYDSWSKCFTKKAKPEWIRLINEYSHNKLVSIEYFDLPENDKEMLKEAFKDFVKKYEYA